MVEKLRREVRRHRQGEDGVALVVAIALISVVGLLMAALVAVAMTETRQTGRDRQRSQAVMVAEARVDELVAEIQARPLSELPCGDLTSTAVAVVADRLDVAATVTYYDATGVEIACSDLGVTEAAEALVYANAVSEPIADQAPAVRSVEALLRLTPVYGNDLDKAIFGDSGIRFANHARVYGENGEPNADIYTNGDFRCDNNQHFYGSITAYGSVTMSNSCVVEGDVHALTEYRADNPQVRVNGNVLVSNGNIILNQSALGQQARASGSVTGDVCNGPQGAEKCFPGVSVPPPTRVDFPILNWDGTTQSEWAANGYTTVVTIPGTYGGTDYPCGWWNGGKLEGSDGKTHNLNGKVDGAAAWIFENAWRMTGPTILRSTCSQAVSFQGTGIELNDHLAIFADGGITVSNNAPITSTSSDERNLYLIQPYNTPFACNGSGISLDNQVSVAPNVNVLMYSPCDIHKANQTDHYGQIYSGGQANIDNSLTMYFKPVPVWGTLAASSSIESYHLEMLFKRENT